MTLASDSLDQPVELPVPLGTGGGRLDGRRHRHAVTVGQRVAADPVVIKVPREFINDYLFNFPDTSIAWSFVLALLAAALTARKRIAWWLLLGNMVLFAVLNVVDIVDGGNTPPRASGRTSGSRCTSSAPSC